MVEMGLEWNCKSCKPSLSYFCTVTRTLQMHPAETLVALKADSSTCDIAGTYRAQVRSCRTMVGVYVACDQETKP